MFIYFNIFVLFGERTLDKVNKTVTSQQDNKAQV